VHWHCQTEALIWRELEGELVVRSARTGSTHLLEPLAAAVLRALLEADAGLTVPDLVARLHVEGAFAAIDTVLSEFQRLGLAEAGPL
jgi:hypothetical protein